MSKESDEPNTYATSEISKKGYEVEEYSKTELRFNFKGNTIYFFPYSGWAQGKGITPCRGIKNLLKQI